MRVWLWVLWLVASSIPSVFLSIILVRRIAAETPSLGTAEAVLLFSVLGGLIMGGLGSAGFVLLGLRLVERNGRIIVEQKDPKDR